MKCMMLLKRVTLAIAFAHLFSTLAYGQQSVEPVRPAAPRVYALIAAVGTQFTFVHEEPTTGTHLSPHRRRTTDALNDALNRIALHSLDRAMEKVDPDSKRLYLSFASGPLDGVAPAQRDSVVVSRVLAEVRNMPERMEWDRIVIATPAYRAMEHDRLAGKLQGFGLISQPLCQGGCGVPGMWGDTLGENGVEAVTSEDKVIRARTFVAPFSYVGIWIVDPKTLVVLDHQQEFDEQRLANDPHLVPSPGGLDLDESGTQSYVFSRLSRLIESSVADAVMHSEIAAMRGKVEVGPVREVPPEEADK
ncbi:MAG TPA: hypothetical protein VKG21_03650 [Casimicrobiaceae bacterium]|nr:hypothetical protein [Casimicrobiaceae bacterium]